MEEKFFEERAALEDKYQKLYQPLYTKVSARRLPKVSETKVLEEAPVFHPTEEEFSDTLAYIASLMDKAKPYGICCVVPPPSWKPPCLLEEQKIWETTTFTTQLQLFDGDCTEKPKEADVKSDDSASKKVKLCRIECGPRNKSDACVGIKVKFCRIECSPQEGANGAEWLIAFKGYIENPDSMLL